MSLKNQRAREWIRKQFLPVAQTTVYAIAAASDCLTVFSLISRNVNCYNSFFYLEWSRDDNLYSTNCGLPRKELKEMQGLKVLQVLLETTVLPGRRAQQVLRAQLGLPDPTVQLAQMEQVYTGKVLGKQVLAI